MPILRQNEAPTQLRVGVDANVVDTSSASKPYEARVDNTLGVLARVAGKALIPSIERAQEDWFVDGMSKAASGAAIEDIAKSQSLGERIFGQNDSVEGAKAYGGMANANNVINGILTEMPQLRQKNPGEFSEEVKTRLQSAKTGDSSTDTYMMAHATKLLPSVIKTQTKSYYTWTQEEATSKETSNIQTGAEAIRQAHAQAVPGDLSASFDIGTLSYNYAQSTLTPQANRDIKGWSENVLNNAVNLLDNGNFHAYNALSSGGLHNVVGAEGSTKLLAAESKARAKSKEAFMANPEVNRAYVMLMANAKNPETITPNQLYTELNAFNDIYKRQTGDSNGFFTQKEIAEAQIGGLTKLHDERVSEAKRLLTEASAGQREQVKLNVVTGLVAAGDKAAADRTGLGSEYNKLSAQTFNAANTEQKVYMVLKQKNNVDGIKDILESQVADALSTQDVKSISALSNMFSSINKVDTQKAHFYFGTYATPMMTYVNAVEGGAPPVWAFGKAFTKTYYTTLDTGVHQKGVEAADAHYAPLIPGTSWLYSPSDKQVVKDGKGATDNRLLGFDPSLAEGQAAKAVSLMNRTIAEKVHAGMDVKTAVKIAINIHEGKDFEKVGQYIVPIPHGGESLLNKVMRNTNGNPMPSDEVGNITNTAINSLVYGYKSTSSVRSKIPNSRGGYNVKVTNIDTPGMLTNKQTALDVSIEQLSSGNTNGLMIAVTPKDGAPIYKFVDWATFNKTLELVAPKYYKPKQ